MSLATVTILGAYARASGPSVRPTISDKIARTERAVSPSSSGAVRNAAQVTPEAGTTPIISEFRLSGPNGVNDEFIEVYNSSNAALTVTATSGTGFGIAASDGILRCTIPNGTIIPARGHFLCTNSLGYSYSAYPAGSGTTATGDATYAVDIPDNVGIALFNNNILANFTLANRLDAVGSTTEANTLYKEGAGYPALSTPITIDHSWVRKAAGLIVTNPPFGGVPGTGFPQDIDDNASDFIFVDTNGTSVGGGQRLGAPGPENLSSPVFTGSGITRSLTETCVAAGAVPNKVRDFTSVPSSNSTFGTINLRRTYTNNTGGNLTRLRFRILNLATFPAAAGIADLRAISSSPVVVTVDRTPCGSGTSNITVQGAVLEVDNTAPSTGQPNGGGFNSSFSAATVTLGTPLANGASVDVGFLFGLQQTGSYKLAVIAEAAPTGGDLWILTGNTEDGSDVDSAPPTAPTITPTAGGITRQVGTAASISQIATVSDTNAGTLTVAATTVPAGLTVSTIVNTAGNVTASVSANCGAVVGANTVVLTVTNGTTGQSATANLTVNVTANTGPTLTYTSPQAAVFGGPATVNPATGPTDNGSVATVAVQSPGTFTGLASVNPAGVVSLSNSAPTGNSTITIRATDNCGTTTDATFTVNVGKASTTTTVASSANPSTFGQAVTFTATVAAVAPGAGLPTGTVTFLDGATTLGTGALNGAGQATFSLSTLSAGAHAITASYAGDTNFLASVSTALTQTVIKAPSLTALTSAPNPSSFGQVVTFTATVTSNGPPLAPPGGPATRMTRTVQTRTTATTRGRGVTPAAVGTGTPTGTVTFLDVAAPIGTAALNGSGVATFTISTLSAGSHSITASYPGDANFTLSVSPAVIQVVGTTNTTLSNVTSSANPSVFGQTVTFSTTAAPVAPGGGVPAGTVSFFDGVTLIGTGTLNGSGVATLAISSLAVGPHSITATYAGNANFNASATLAPLVQTVNKDATTTVITTTVQPAPPGSTVTFTATVAAAAPGSGVPTGTVQFKDNGVNLGGPVTLVAGKASVTETNLTQVVHTITTVYSGDANFLTSNGTLVQNIGFTFIDPVNGNKLVIDLVNQTYTFTAGTTVIALNVPVHIQFDPVAPRTLRFTSVSPIVTQVLIDESAPGTLQGKFFVPSTGLDFVMNITSGVVLH